MNKLTAKKTGRSWLKILVYPATRPAADISKSVSGIKGAWKQAEEIKRKRIEDAKAVTQYLAGKTPHEKFEEIYQANRWTEPELACQARAARNTRLGSLALVVVLFPVLIWLVATSSLWVSMLAGVCSMALFAACVAQAIRFAWWEAQIEERSCFPMREFLSRKDIFRRVIRL